MLARLPRESQANVLYRPRRRIPRAEAEAVAAEVARRLTLGGRRCKATPVGSVRRQAAVSKDLDILAVAPAARAAAALGLRPPRRGDRAEVADVYAAGPRRHSLVLRVLSPGRPARHYRADVFLATPAERPFALFHFTGSRRYNVRTRAHAKRRGWLLNQYGLFDAATGAPARGAAAVRSERDLARLLGVTYRPPTDRER